MSDWTLDWTGADLIGGTDYKVSVCEILDKLTIHTLRANGFLSGSGYKVLV